MLFEKTIRGIAGTMLVCLALTGCQSAMDNNVPPRAAVVDCPLRDAPFSADMPLMDLLQSTEAKAVVAEHSPNLLSALPAHMVSTEPPSFSAIISLRQLLGMGGQSVDVSELDRQLRTLEVTERDQRARCARYDSVAPTLAIPEGSPRVLVFDKITGYRDEPSVEAAAQLLETLAADNGWALVTTDNGAVMQPHLLQQFDLVIWNNISGDVLTLSQRKAFVNYIEAGGGYVGIHGSGGDPNYFWDWYAETLLGARFIGHTMNPQYQDARIETELHATGPWQSLPEEWHLNDEWYAFDRNPRENGSIVVAALDEQSYSPKGMFEMDISMGDHPIAWLRCVGKGRSFYSAIGHRPEVYRDKNHAALLQGAVEWAAGSGQPHCAAH